MSAILQFEQFTGQIFSLHVLLIRNFPEGHDVQLVDEYSQFAQLASHCKQTEELFKKLKK
jgi:hypothetical protein